MQYMLMCCGDEELWTSLPEAQRGKIMQEYEELIQAIGKSGHLRASVKLGPSSTSTTVRERDGKTVITDGPFAETKEQLGGYHVVECKDLDEAISIARRIPTLRVGGSIDVRPVEQGWAESLDRLDESLAQEQTARGAKGEALAQQFEAKAREASAVLAKLSDADWKKMTEAEQWTVGVTAHHLAGTLEAVAGIVTTVVSGPSRGNAFTAAFGQDFTGAMLDEMNATHAKEHANCTRAETIALLERGAAAAAAVVRGLSDEQLAKSGTVFADAPPMTVEQLVIGGLITHIDEHLGSIRKTVGH